MWYELFPNLFKMWINGHFKSSFLLYFSILHFTVDEKELEEKNKQREAKKQKLYFGMFDLQSKTNENIFT